MPLCDKNPVFGCEINIFAGLDEVAKLHQQQVKSCKNRQNKAKSRNLLQDFNGADGRIRTGDLILTKDALYLLSYISAFALRRTQMLLYYSQR